MITSLLQADRLEKFAKRLMSMDIRPKIKLVKTSCRLFLIDEKFIGTLPLLYGPLQLLPRIFKEDWILTEDGNIYWKGDRSKNTINSLQLYFGMNLVMVSHCWIAGAQNVNLFGGSILSQHCTGKEVATNIIHLIKSQILSQEILTTINSEYSKFSKN